MQDRPFSMLAVFRVGRDRIGLGGWLEFLEPPFVMN